MKSSSGALAYQAKVEESRLKWKTNIKAKLKAKGHEITPWLEKHIDYLATLSQAEYKAEILKFNQENPESAVEVREASDAAETGE